LREHLVFDEEVDDGARQPRQRELAGPRDTRPVHTGEQALLAQAPDGVCGARRDLLGFGGHDLTDVLEGIHELQLAEGR
jgi:hypothetical protein